MAVLFFGMDSSLRVSVDAVVVLEYQLLVQECDLLEREK